MRVKFADGRVVPVPREVSAQGSVAIQEWIDNQQPHVAGEPDQADTPVATVDDHGGDE